MEHHNQDSVYSVRDTSKLSNKDIISILQERIERNIQTYLPEVGRNHQSTTGGKWGGTGTARTFRFEIAASNNKGKHILFVKLSPIFRKWNPGTLEYEALRMLYPKMSEANNAFQVARPIDFYYDLNALVMESVGDRSFKKYLLRINSKNSDEDTLSNLYSIIAGCGKWVSTFHRITRKGVFAKFYGIEFIKTLEKEFEFLKGFNFNDDVIKKCDNILEKLFCLDGKFSLPCAMWHCDLTPSHVFIDNNKISVIDILGLEDIPIYEDIGKWLSGIATVNAFPLYIRFDYERANGKFADLFLQAYLSENDYNRDEFIMFSNIFKLKHLFISFEAQTSRISKKVHPIAGDIFSRLRLRKIYEKNIFETVDNISEKMKMFV